MASADELVRDSSPPYYKDFRPRHLSMKCGIHDFFAFDCSGVPNSHHAIPFSMQVAEFQSWEPATPTDGDGMLRWEWDTEGLWLGIMVSRDWGETNAVICCLSCM